MRASSRIAQEIRLPRSGPSGLAVGAFLKNTVCVTKGDVALVSVGHDDLSDPAAVAAFETSVEALVEAADVTPTWVAHDLHPDFASTRFALGLDVPPVPVQHHHAHAAAIAAEHGYDGALLGLSLDGFGLGEERQSWGGELLACSAEGRFRRLGHLALLPQPGGDVAAREPWRMAAAVLHVLGRGDEIATRWPAFPASRRLGVLLEQKVNAPLTSSAGRLFDAACGLLDVVPVSQMEGQAPQALEKQVTAPTVLPGGWTFDCGVLSFLPLLTHLADHPEDGANLFHGTLIAGLTQWCAWGAQQTGLSTIALGGGCFFNRVLSAGMTEALPQQGLRPLCAVKLSPGDAALSLGQAWVAVQRALS